MLLSPYLAMGCIDAYEIACGFIFLRSHLLQLKCINSITTGEETGTLQTGKRYNSVMN